MESYRIRSIVTEGEQQTLTRATDAHESTKRSIVAKGEEQMLDRHEKKERVKDARSWQKGRASKQELYQKTKKYEMNFSSSQEQEFNHEKREESLTEVLLSTAFRTFNVVEHVGNQ